MKSLFWFVVFVGCNLGFCDPYTFYLGCDSEPSATVVVVDSAGTHSMAIDRDWDTFTLDGIGVAEFQVFGEQGNLIAEWGANISDMQGNPPGWLVQSSGLSVFWSNWDQSLNLPYAAPPVAPSVGGGFGEVLADIMGQLEALFGVVVGVAVLVVCFFVARKWMGRVKA